MNDYSSSVVSSGLTSSDNTPISYELAQFNVMEEPIRIDESAYPRQFSELIISIVTDNQNAVRWKSSSILLTSQKKLEAALNHDYTETLLNASTSGPATLEHHLVAASYMVQQFLDIQSLFASCNSMTQSIQESVFQTLERYLQPRLHDYYSDP